MSNEQCGLSDHHYHTKRISWTAVIVGALVGIGLSFLLNLFSIAIGLSIVRTTQEGMASLAVGGLLGLLFGTIVAMFAAGFAAGYLGRPYCIKRNLGVLYGFTTWCLALILTALLTSHIGHFAANYSNFVNHPTAIVITDTTAENAPAVNASKQSNNTAVVAVNTQKATNSLGIGALLIFVLFFVGALASCFGGHFGMSCGKGCCPHSNENKI